MVKVLDFGGVFRYTYLYEKVTPVEVSSLYSLLFPDEERLCSQEPIIHVHVGCHAGVLFGI